MKKFFIKKKVNFIVRNPIFLRTIEKDASLQIVK